MKRIRIQFLLLLFIVFSSCVKDLDFKQAEDLSITPVFNSSLVFFTLNQSNFLDTTGLIETQSISDISDFRVFDNDFIQENLIGINFDIEVKNEFDRGFIANIDLLDENDAVVYQLTTLNIAATQLDFTHKEVIDLSTNQALLDVTKIRVIISLAPSIILLNQNDPSEFEFKSSFTLFVETQ